jgi:hypothetical protein
VWPGLACVGCTEVGPSVGVVFKLRAGQLWDRGLTPVGEKRYLISPSLLSNEYRDRFLGVKTAVTWSWLIISTWHSD